MFKGIEMANEVKGRPVDLAYAGRRQLVGGKTGYIFYIVQPDGSLGPELMYLSIKPQRTVGAVYTGARYDEEAKVMYGLSVMRWKCRYAEAHPDGAVRVAAWEAIDNEFDKDKASKRAEEKYKSPVVEALLPLRRIIRELHKRGQHHEAGAYRDMIVAELFRPLTQAERETNE